MHRFVRLTLHVLAGLIFTLSMTSLAHAQAARTWVSGVGDDANPGSRTAPCKTFAGAYSRTAVGGEIDALDPGGFGGVTISKGITIDGGGTLASILVSGTNAINVQAGPNDVIILRHLRLTGSGQNGLAGIRFVSGKALIIEDCYIFGFLQSGISVGLSTSGSVTVKNTNITNCGTGIYLTASAGVVYTTLDHIKLDLNIDGLNVAERAFANIRDSTISHNNDGLKTTPTSVANLAVVNCQVNNNTNNAIRAGAGSTITLTGVTVDQNSTGLIAEGGSITSFGDNKIFGNTTNGAPTSTVAPQ